MNVIYRFNSDDEKFFYNGLDHNGNLRWSTEQIYLISRFETENVLQYIFEKNAAHRTDAIIVQEFTLSSEPIIRQFASK